MSSSTTQPTAITVPSIHSTDRDERIAARRARIQSRSEQRKKGSEISRKGVKDRNSNLTLFVRDRSCCIRTGKR
jgi:hypothetical protein